MKHKRKKSAVVNGVMVLAAIFGAFLLVGLFLPALQPLALQLGTLLSLAFLAGGFVAAVYASWRIATYPSRSRKAILRAQHNRHYQLKVTT